MVARRGLLYTFTVVLVAAAVLPMAVLGAWSIVSGRGELMGRSAAALEAIADAQLARVDGTYHSARTSIRLIASRTQMRDDFAAVVAGDDTDVDRLQQIIDDAREASIDVHALWLTDPQASVVIDSIGPSVAADVGFVEVVERHAATAMATLVPAVDVEEAEGLVTHVVIGDPAGPPRLLLFSPLVLDGAIVGLVVAEFDVAPLVAVVANDVYAGPVAELFSEDAEQLGQSGASEVGRGSRGRQGQLITCLYERLDDGAARPLFDGLSGTSDCGLPANGGGGAEPIPAERAELPAIRAAHGQVGMVEDVLDVHDNRVVAVMRYAEGPRWGLTVRVSRDDVFAPAAAITRRTIAVAAIVMAASVLGAYVMAGALSRRLLMLRDGALRVAEQSRRRTAVLPDGRPAAPRDHHGAVLPVDAPGELGDLARAFHDMASTVDEQQAQLERRVDQLEVVAHAMAHDLKNPLSTIMGVLSTLQGDRISDPDLQRDLLRRGMAASERMRRLIDDLLAVMQADRVVTAFREVDLDALVADVVRNRSAEAFVTVPNRLGQLRGDAVLLQQAVDNVVANALAYHAPGRTPRVEVTVERDGDGGVLLHIDDAGVGIPPDEREAILGLFVRGSNVAQTAGTGVGLAIVERVAAQHGGSVHIGDSALGGTRITLALRPR